MKYAIVALLFIASQAQATGASFSYEGRAFDSGGNPLTEANVQFKLQVRSPSTSDCLLYEEIQLVNLSGTNGFFTLALNDGTATSSTLNPAITGGFNQVFSSSLSGVNTGCNNGSYSASPDDKRMLVVSIASAASGNVFEPLAPVAMGAVPTAIEAQQLAGLPTSMIMRLQPGVSLSPLSTTNAADLTSFFNGGYAKSSVAGGTSVVASGSQPSNITTSGPGTLWYNTNLNQLMVYNGSTSIPAGGGGSGITALTGDVTASGTGSVGATVANVGGVSASMIAAGATLANAATDASTINTIVKRDAAGMVATNGLITKNFELYDSSGSKHISVRAPLGMPVDYPFYLPTTWGSASQVLTTDGAGHTSWQAAGGGSQWTTSGSDIYFTGGHVGIGTLPSSNSLDVSGDTRLFSGVSTGVGLTLEGDAGGGHVFRLAATGPGNGEGTGAFIIRDQTTSNTPLVINSTGNVGMGVTYPSANLHLKAGGSVANSAPLKLTNSGSQLATPEDGAMEYSSGILTFTIGVTRYMIPMNQTAGNYSSVNSISNTSGSIIMTPMAGNSVNIVSTTTSTSSTTGALLVSGGAGISGAVNTGGNISSGGAVTATTNMVTPQIYGGMAAAADIHIDGTSHATTGNVILASAGGKVGIGTSSPSSLLEVKQSIGAPTLIQVNNPSSSANSSAAFQAGSLSKAITMGVLGPSSSITGVSGNEAYVTTPGNLVLQTTSGTGVMRFQVGPSGTEQMRINATGNVGIGTSAPSTKLEVAGPVKMGLKGSQVSAMGICALNGGSTVTVATATDYSCMGVEIGGVVNCSPMTAPASNTYVWSTYVVTNDNVRFTLSGASSLQTWKCSYMNP